MKSISSGVPQGSVLEPLLYILYINSMQKIGLKGTYTVYADDTVIIYSGNVKEEIDTNINSDMLLLDNWMRMNLLTINIQKTLYMVFRKNIEIDMKFTEVALTRTNVTAYLGMMIDDNLTWDEHIKKMQKKVIATVGALRRHDRLLRKAVRAIYTAHIMTHITYCITAWSQCSATNKLKVSRLMNKALKVLYGFQNRTPTVKVYRLTDNVQLSDVIFTHNVTYIYRTMHGTLKNNKNYKVNNEVHEHYTRTKTNLHMESVRTNRGLNKNKAIKDYNSLPEEIKKCSNYRQFKIRVRKFL